jgi:hypothetical protein
MESEQSPDTPRQNELVQTGNKAKLTPEERKQHRASAYKVYYERRKEEILSHKKETYNQVQKREYYSKNKEYLNGRMKDRYYCKKEDELRAKLIAMKDRFPCEEMKKYIDKLLSEGTFKQFTPRMLEFWTCEM